MRTQTQREIQRESRWREIVAGQRQSGQSVRAYCRQAGIEESAFYWWRRKLAQRSRQGHHLPPARRQGRVGVVVGREGRSGRSEERKPSGVGYRAPSKMVTGRGVEFLPLRIKAQQRAPAETVAGRSEEAGRAIEVALGGQCVVRIRPGFDRQTLARVLAVLEGRPC